MMRFLLDTHVLIWYLEGNSNLAPRQRELVVNSDNEVLVSIASLWEIAAKTSIGKLTISRSMTEILKQLATQSIEILSIEPAHVLQVAKLPLHHRDPFDRMIIAQSKVGFLPVLTHDRTFLDYGIKLL